MSLLILNGLSRKPALVRRCSLLLPLRHLCNGFSSSSLPQTPPCAITGADCGYLIISNAGDDGSTTLEKRVPMELVYNRLFDNKMVTIGSSHGWVATLDVDDGILRLQDDLNPAVSDTDTKCVPLPPLVTLPHCQTQIVTNVSLSSSSPEDEDCVVAVKFLGPQLSFCKPGQSNSEWTNIRIENPCFYSSRVMFSDKDQMFRIPGSGGHLIGSWDLCEHVKEPKLQRLRYKNYPKLTRTKGDLMDSCCTTEHLVESITTGETFLVKWYKKTAKIVKGIAKMKTQELMVFKLDEQGNAVYTDDIGDLCIFLSKSDPFCVRASAFPGLIPNYVYILDVDEVAFVNLADTLVSLIGKFSAPFYIPPQNVEIWN